MRCGLVAGKDVNTKKRTQINQASAPFSVFSVGKGSTSASCQWNNQSVYNTLPYIALWSKSTVRLTLRRWHKLCILWVTVSGRRWIRHVKFKAPASLTDSVAHLEIWTGGGYISGIHFQKCSKCITIFFTLNISTIFFTSKGGPRRKGLIKKRSQVK